MLVPKENTFVIPVIRTDLISRCLETLYAYTPDNFYVFVIDQSIGGIDMSLRDKYNNLMIIRSPRTDVHHTGNLGFTQASNLGVRLAETPYVTFLNDDVEFIHSEWWSGIQEAFLQVAEATPTRPPLLVTAASVKLPDWSVGRPAGEDHYILPYKEKYTDEDWHNLVKSEHFVNKHLTIKPGSVVDGINLYCSVADTKKLLEVGLLDEFWYPGGADDYDLCCRASMFGYRCIATTKSWIFHHWSQTFSDIRDKVQLQELVQPELKHGDLNEKYGFLDSEKTKPRFDLWGIRCTQCDSILHTTDGNRAVCPQHPDTEVYLIPENTTMPL